MSNEKIIWPKIFRLLHWGIALPVLLDQFVLEDGDPPHRYLGYLALFSVVVRVVIGLKEKKLSRAHNVIAAIVYYLIWLLVISLALTGWLLGTDYFWGNETLEKIHELLSNALMGLVFLHLIGIIRDAWLEKRKTWMGMITGKRPPF